MSSTTTTYTLDITLENSLDYLIDQSWNKCVGSKDEISLAQITILIKEIETLLKIDSLFTTTEQKIISQFLDENSSLKASKSYVKQFILTLISPESFASLLRNRFGLSNEVIKARINGSRYSSNNTFHIWRKYQSTAESKAKSIKDEEIEKLKKEIANLKQTNNEKEIKLRISEREINRLKTRIEDLTTFYKSKGDGERTLAAQLADKNASLVELTQLCKKYKDACIEYKQREKETALAFKTLEREIMRQNETIQSLQSQLPIEDNSNLIKDFFRNLPIFKQSYLLLKYKHDLKDKRVLVMSITSIICLFLLMVNLVQVVYILLSIMLASIGKDSGIVYDDNMIRSPGLIELLSTIPSIEKFVYDYIDW